MTVWRAARATRFPSALRWGHGAHRGLRAAQRPPNGGARQPDGLDRLVLFPALRLGCLFRGASRHPRARALAARSGRRGTTLDPSLPARHADPRVGLRDRRGQREGDRVHASTRRRSRHRAHRGGPGRKRPDAIRARDQVRLRRHRPLGTADRSCPGGRRRARRPLPPHAARDSRRGDDDGFGVHDRGRPADPVRADLVPVARAAAARDRSGGGPDGNGGVLARVGSTLRSPRASTTRRSTSRCCC